MKNVILWVRMDTHFVELSRVARLLVSSGRYQPVFWFSTAYDTRDQDIDTCRAGGWLFISSPRQTLSKSPSLSASGWHPHYLKIKEKVFYVWRYLANQGKTRRIIKNLIEGVQDIVREFQPALLVIAEDNVGYYTHILIRTFVTNGVHTVVVPYTIANATETAESLYGLPGFDARANFINRWVARKYPHWVYAHRDRQLLRSNPWEITTLEESGFHYTRPWTMNSEDSTIIAVENEHMLEYYRNEGLPAKRLVVTGALYDDVLAEGIQDAGTKRRKLFEELGLPHDRPLVLCALPPSQFPRQCEFDNYTALLEFWMESLASLKDWNVVIRPHPRTTMQEIDSIQHHNNCITTRDTASLVPLCDLYLATASATIRWAIACGIPVINYDIYRWGYKDYTDVEGVLTIDHREAFLLALRRLTTDKPYYEQIATAQKKGMKRWGRLDGKSGERMLQLFDDVIEGKYKENSI